VVGINSQIFSNSGGYMGVSFAIPMDVAMNVSDQLKATGRVERGQLGVEVGPVTADSAKGFNLPDTRGALVSNVRVGSPAEKAGLEPGDVIRSVDGTPINESSDLPPVIGSLAPGRTVKLSILRNGKAIERSVTLTRLDDGVAGAGPAERRGPQAAPSAPKAANRLGLVGQELSPQQRRDLNLRNDEGVQLARVESGAGRAAGLRPGDVVLRVGTTPVSSPEALDRALAGFDKDQTVMLLVRRGGGTQFFAVTPDDKG
jgi:serine protease Do